MKKLNSGVYVRSNMLLRHATSKCTMLSQRSSRKDPNPISSPRRRERPQAGRITGSGYLPVGTYAGASNLDTALEWQRQLESPQGQAPSRAAQISRLQHCALGVSKGTGLMSKAACDCKTPLLHGEQGPRAHPPAAPAGRSVRRVSLCAKAVLMATLEVSSADARM